MVRGLLSRFRAAHAHLRHPGRAARRVKQRERARRAGFMADAAKETSHVAVERDGSLFILPTRQKGGIDRFLKPEWKETRHLQRALEALERHAPEVPRTVFLDVGAHIGTTAITAVRRFGFESALAFEPELSNFRLLRANLEMNGLDGRIHAMNVAVSNRVGTAELKLRPSMGSKQRLVEGDEPGVTTVTVPLTTLDSLVAEGTLDPAKVGLLWLDIEGHELQALQGAETLLRHSVPIVMEFIPRALLVEGRIAPLGSALFEHYTHVVDLRQRVRGGPQLLRPEQLEQLARRYERSFTDLLVFRHP